MKNKDIVFLYPFTESWIDYPDSTSLCLTIYFLGCDNKCINCSNPFFQNKNYKHSNVQVETDTNVVAGLIKDSAKKSKTNKLVFIGGDPLYVNNIQNTKKILELLKNEFDICIYTGHSLQYTKDNRIEGFSFLKVNKYLKHYRQESKKTDTYIQFASTNQELYDSNFNLISKNGIYYFQEGFYD